MIVHDKSSTASMIIWAIEPIELIANSGANIMNILALQQFSPPPFGLSTLRCRLRDFMGA
jgi:hypothetical protein